MRGIRLTLVAALATLVPTAAAPVAEAVPAPQSAGAEVTTTLRKAIADLPVATEDRTGYDRDRFDLWVDADGDGCNTREEVLIVESTVDVTRGSGCDVTSGEWFSYYDEATWTDPSDLDIDHMVPLAEAWDSGARSWDADTRERYANDLADPRTLVAVTDNVNQSKSDQDPAEWMPQHGQCTYIAQWVAAKMRWQLTADTAEKQALANRAEQCTDVTITVTEADVTGDDGGSGGGEGATISTVVYDPSGSDTDANLDQEAVTIGNTGQDPVSMEGWTLVDAAGHRYTFPALTLDPGADVTVHSGDGTDSGSDLYAGWGHIWNNSGDTATLQDASGTTVDTCTWGDGDGSAAC